LESGNPKYELEELDNVLFGMIKKKNYDFTE